MRVWAVVLVLGLVMTTAEASNGLRHLRCDALLGPIYEISVDNHTLTLAEREWEYHPTVKLLTHVRHVFPLSQCRFEPFSINLSCRDSRSSAALQVVLTPKQSSVSGRYNEVEFRLQGIPGIEPHRFETRKIESGRAAHCYINGVFEVL